jgi:long-subunit acyl-CoA synthetase (AMP-forming)
MLVKTSRSQTCEYFEEEQLNAEAFTADGFYRTGDIVEIYAPGRVRVIDRRKNFFKLQQGEFVVPQQLEVVLSGSLFVDQICVVGSLSESSLLAIVFPKLSFALDFLEQAETTALPELRAAIQQAPDQCPVALLQHPRFLPAVRNDSIQVGIQAKLKKL